MGWGIGIDVGGVKVMSEGWIWSKYIVWNSQGTNKGILKFIIYVLYTYIHISEILCISYTA